MPCGWRASLRPTGSPLCWADHIRSLIPDKRVYYRLDSGTVDEAVEVTQLMSIGLGTPVGIVHSEVKDITTIDDSRISMI